MTGRALHLPEPRFAACHRGAARSRRSSTLPAIVVVLSVALAQTACGAGDDGPNVRTKVVAQCDCECECVSDVCDTHYDGAPVTDCVDDDERYCEDDDGILWCYEPCDSVPESPITCDGMCREFCTGFKDLGAGVQQNCGGLAAATGECSPGE